MEQSPENFESLQKLLRLKRHEQPHPRYFNDFSRQVIARIEAGEARTAPRWWERFGFDVRPAITFAAGAAACCLLFFAVASDNDATGTTGGLSAAMVRPSTAAEASEATAATVSSTNPIYNAAGTMMLDQLRGQVRPVGFFPTSSSAPSQ